MEIHPNPILIKRKKTTLRHSRFDGGWPDTNSQPLVVLCSIPYFSWKPDAASQMSPFNMLPVTSPKDTCPDGYYKSGAGKLNRTCALCPMDAMKCISPTAPWHMETTPGSCSCIGLPVALVFERQSVIGQLLAFQDFDRALWSVGLRLEPKSSLFFISLFFLSLRD